MDSHIIINPEHPGTFYAFFYLLAFLGGVILLLWEGHRRKFPLVPWMMVIATAFLFFITGCRLIAFSENEWTYVLRFESIPYTTARSVLGGILFSIPGILLAKKFLQFKHDMVDAFAFVLPLALMVQRFGCLMAGCCFGTPTHLPWSVQYGPRFHAFSDQLQLGLVPSGSTLSLPIHPVQVYEAICALIILILLTRIRKLLRAPGNLFLISFGLYGGFRFLLEFIRASGGHTVGGQMLWDLSRVQWVILILLPLLFFFILHREKTFATGKSILPSLGTSYYRPAAYFILMGMVFLFVSRWLDVLEIISLNMVLLPMLVIVTWYLFASVTVPRFRLAALALPLGSLFLMSQTFPEQSRTDSTRLNYTTISTGWTGGITNLSDIIDVTTGGYSCNGMGTPPHTTTTTTQSGNRYSMGALGISHTVQLNAEKSISFGAIGFSGSHRENFSQNVTGYVVNPVAPIYIQQEFSYYGIKPYVQLDQKHFGIGGGIAIGQMGQFNYSRDNKRSVAGQFGALPSLSFRIGNLSRIFLDYRLNNQFAPSFPALTHQIAAGFCLGKAGSILRIGTGSYVSMFFAPSIVAGKNFVIEPYFGFGGGINRYTKAETLIGAINVHYKFNRKERRLN